MVRKLLSVKVDGAAAEPSTRLAPDGILFEIIRLLAPSVIGPASVRLKGVPPMFEAVNPLVIVTAFDTMRSAPTGCKTGAVVVLFRIKLPVPTGPAVNEAPGKAF